MHPDLALIDLQLEGGLDGPEVAARLRERFDIAVLYLRVCSISGEWSRHVIFQVDCNPRLGGPHALEQDHSQGL